MYNKVRITVVAAICLTSCVPLKQYRNVESQMKALQTQNEGLVTEADELRNKSTELEGALKRQKNWNDQLIDDTLRLANEIDGLKERVAQLTAQNKELSAQLMQTGSAQEQQELMAYLQKIQNDLQQREDALRKAEKEGSGKKQKLDEAIAELEGTRARLLEQNTKLQELEKALNEKENALSGLRNAIADALTGFGPDQLNVNVRNGKIYVAMEEKLLFSSGSYDVNQQGAAALQKIAGVLVDKPEIQVTVEGHTDDVAYKSGVLLDNWDLSVKRATSVVRIILQSNKIAPSRITASGRSQFVPIANGKDATARQKNRRTEIILEPSMDKLLNIIGGK